METHLVMMKAKREKKMNERDDDERVQDELPSFSFAELTKLKLS